jgi:hypothetical protein
LVHLPVVGREPDVVFSAVKRRSIARSSPILSLYEVCRVVVRTLSNDTLLRAFLSELRGHALGEATDRLYLKAPAVSTGGKSLLLPPSAARNLVRLERASLRVGSELTAVPALVLDLKNGRPVAEFSPSSNGSNGYFSGCEAIAVHRSTSGDLPSRAEVLFELAQHAPNLRSVGERGLDALGAFVERAQLVEWDEIRPVAALEHLRGEPLATGRAV